MLQNSLLHMQTLFVLMAEAINTTEACFHLSHIPVIPLEIPHVNVFLNVADQDKNALT